MTTSAGQAIFTLKLNDRLSSRLKSVSAGVVGIVKRIGAVGTAVSAAAAAAGLASVKSFADFGDKIDKLSVRTRVSREALQELSFAAKLTGTNIDALAQAMFRASRRIGNAALGTGPAVRALKEIGIDAKSLAAKSPAEQFEKIAEAMEKIGNPNIRNQMGFEIFGDNFREIQPLFAAGAESIRKMRTEARELGLVLSGADISKAAMLSDQMAIANEQMRMSMVKLGASLSTTVIPAMMNLSDIMQEMAIKFAIIQDAMRAMSPTFQAFMQFNELLIRIKGQGLPGNAGIGDGIGDLPGSAVKRFLDVQGGTSGLSGLLTAKLFSEFDDPKREEKQMVDLLGQINDKGPLVMTA
ncbi:hypothetical protein [Crateriforma conspicua]|uniref:Phage-related minor tail protein n=1 Tax=Crateriforma conspicua TaxID=2527996 RepID=A0A5C5Y2G5_9PLAN|nr:hypothetical protein [Crateriforma conspicua]TWT69360.1 hypothetical protein Pan14r_16460 [Crateriforma conspicua]